MMVGKRYIYIITHPMHSLVGQIKKNPTRYLLGTVLYILIALWINSIHRIPPVLSYNAKLYYSRQMNLKHGP